MNIAVLGTGMVGLTIASALVEAGHPVRMGSRSAGNPRAVEWSRAAGPLASHGSFAEAARFGEVVFNCTAGVASLEALQQAGEENLRGKVLIDVANPLDFSRGMPPSLSVCNTDSLAEQIQRALPGTRVVKALNTMNCRVMVDPGRVPGEHHVFLSGNDADAKARVAALLTQAFHWPAESILDLGGLDSARANEMLVPVWVRLWGALGTGDFNFHVAGAPARPPAAVQAPAAEAAAPPPG
jgi:8-hydroxy-5-deazaflavin:NADPH oxidoreductase